MPSPQSTLHAGQHRQSMRGRGQFEFDLTLLELFWFPEGRRHVDIGERRKSYPSAHHADAETYAQWERRISEGERNEVR